jgi:hypothetical protein
MDEQQWQPTRPGEISVREIVPSTGMRTKVAVVALVGFGLAGIFAMPMLPPSLGDAVFWAGLIATVSGAMAGFLVRQRERSRHREDRHEWCETGATVPIRANALAARVPLRDATQPFDAARLKRSRLDQVSLARELAASLREAGVHPSRQLRLRASWFMELEESVGRPLPRLWVIDDAAVVTEARREQPPMRRHWWARWFTPTRGLPRRTGALILLLALGIGAQAALLGPSGQSTSPSAIAYSTFIQKMMLATVLVWGIVWWVWDLCLARRDDGALRLVPLVGRWRGFSLEPEECRVVVYRKILAKKPIVLRGYRLSPPIWRFMHDATNRVVEVPNFDPAGTAWEPLARELGQVNDRDARGRG